MNIITDMGYRIFKQIKCNIFIAYILLLPMLVNPSIGATIYTCKKSSEVIKVNTVKPTDYSITGSNAKLLLKVSRHSKLNLYTPAPPPPPASIKANADSGVVNGYNGNVSLLNIFANDSFNNAPVSGSAIKVTIGTLNYHIKIDTLSGIVRVFSGLAAGDYSVTYSICDTSDLSNCSSAILTVHVNAPAIIANSESASVNGYNGSAGLLNVFSNDSINGNTATVNSVNLSIVTSSGNPRVILNTSTGIVSVAPGTHAGTYSIVYKICDTLNSANCDTADVIITVLAPPIIANADYAMVSSYNGGLNVLYLFSNDSLNSTQVIAGRVNLSLITSPSDPGIFLNTGTGRVSVFPYTLAGIYTFIYRICDTLNTANCDTALITLNIVPPPIIANGDNGTVNGYTGNANLLNIFSNDSLNNKGTTINGVNLSVVTPAVNPKVFLNVSTGIVSVVAGTPAGIYRIQYKICDTLNTSNCDTAIIIVNVTAPVITAHNDNCTVNGYNGNALLLNVLTNDSFNTINVTAGRVNLSIITPASVSGISLNLSTGILSVTAIIPAGTYTLKYKICDTLNAGNCDSAIVTVNVQAPVIVANANRGSVDGAGTLNLLNVLNNDSINNTLASVLTVKITVVTPSSFSGIKLDTATGIISVDPSPTGSYTIIYRLCDKVNPTNCDTSIVFITITPPFIDAINDTASINGYTGAANLINVLSNDSLGHHLIIVGAATITVIQASGNAGITLNTVTGIVSVAPRIPAAIFSIHYKICDTLNPTNCDTAIVYIRIIPPVIDAVNDTFRVNGYNGSTNTLKVLTNDRISTDTARLGAVRISIVSNAGIAGITFDTLTGIVNVATHLPAGTYTIRYRITDTLNAGNSDSAVVLVTIYAPPIIATREKAMIIGYNNYPSLLNVLNNDSINNKIAIAGSVKITVTVPASNPGIILNDTTGIVHVIAPVPPGIYKITYSICDTFYTGSCSAATDTILVRSPVINAADDSTVVSGYNIGLTILNVLTNDSLNNVVITPGMVRVSVLIPAVNSGIRLDTANGVIRFFSRIPAGTYNMEYRICDVLDTSNCDTAIVKLVVIAPVVLALDDSILVDGYTGTSGTFNVLTNDRVNGVRPILGSTIKLKILIGSGRIDITVDSTTGFLNVAPYTPNGNYTISYIISDTLNLGNTDTATIFIRIMNPLIFANDDYVSVNGYDGNLNALNVFANDSFSSTVVTAARVNFTLVSPASNAGVVLNIGNGRISVFPMTPAGVYHLIYRICDTLNASNCDTALVTVNVTAPLIIAHNDSSIINGYNLPANLLNIFINDTLNHNSANPASVKLKVLVPFSNAAIVLDTTTGLVRIIQRTASGVYLLRYQICDTLNPGNCATAAVKITVLAPSIIAVNDTGLVGGDISVPNLLNVLANDSINNTSATTAIVKLRILIPFSNTAVKLDTLTGIVSVKQPIPQGIYTLQYQICDTLNPGNCATAAVVINIEASFLAATNDTGFVSGYVGGVNLLNVLLNDSINGKVADTGSVELYLIMASGNAGVLLDTLTGNLSVAPLTSAGTYIIQYRICDTLNVSNCDTAFVIVYVRSATLSANADSTGINGYHGMQDVLDVLNNDSINGGIANPSLVKLRLLLPSGNLGVTLDTLTGMVSVAPRTPEGNYTICYIINDTLNPSNTDSACATIVVFAVGPIAMPDLAVTPSGTSIIINPLINDYDVDSNINIASIMIALPPLNGIATADTLTGTITYTPGLNWTGFDTLYYSICDSGMVPVLCDTSFIVIHTLDTLSIQNILITNNKCFGDSTGVAEVDIQGGLPPYTIIWNTIPVQTGNIATHLQAGTYQVTITDSAIKSIGVQVTINQPTPLTANAIITEPLCYGNSNGSIYLNVSGGISSYTFLWSNGSVQKDQVLLKEGTYNVTITDSNGCTLLQNNSLIEPGPLNLSTVTTHVICKSSLEGSITVLNITGGVKPYMYLWSTGDTSMKLSNIPDGQYVLTVTDSNGCTAKESLTVKYARETCDHNIFIPQGFSPDGDGINDAFVIDGIEKYPDNYLRIFNRWGGMVFDQHGYVNTWKGTVEDGVVLEPGDQILPTGTYFYVLDLGQGIKTKSGYFYISK